jgi:hypothetical protein
MKRRSCPGAAFLFSGGRLFWIEAGIRKHPLDGRNHRNDLASDSYDRNIAALGCVISGVSSQVEILSSGVNDRHGLGRIVLNCHLDASLNLEPPLFTRAVPNCLVFGSGLFYIVETNKEFALVTTKRKRAPGGGRKPQGDIVGKSAAFATRITPEVRRWLEAEAKQSRLSLSQAAERVFRGAMHLANDAQKRNRALAHSIARLAESVERDTGKSWLDDPFTGQALRYAIDALAFHLAPTPNSGSAVPPKIEEAAERMLPEIAARVRTPAGLGHMVATHLITEIELSANPPEANEWSVPMTFNASTGELKQIGSDLGLVKKRKEK